MNEVAAKAAARARRFDVELAAVLGASVPTAVETAPRTGGGARAWRAAMLVLGVVATFAVAWQQRGCDDEAQSADALVPPAVPSVIPCAQRGKELAKWPHDLQGARLWLFDDALVRDLTPITAFRELRYLAITNQGAWTPDGLAVLAQLPHLEQLDLLLQEHLTAAHVRELAALPRLRFLSLGLSRTRELGTDEVDALATLPALASLRLQGGRIGPAAIARLQRLPHLRELEIEDGDHVPEAALLALAEVKQLRSLRLTSMGAFARPLLRRTTDPEKRTAGLSPAVAAALQQLPALRRLVLDEVETTAAALAGLPATLEHVTVTRAPWLGPDAFAALARLPKLRGLGLDAGDWQAVWGDVGFSGETRETVRAVFDAAPAREAVWAAQAALLRRVEPLELRWTGAMPDEVREAVAALPLLAIELVRPRAAERELLATFPGLRRIHLADCRLHHDELGSLAAIPNLLSLRLERIEGIRPREVRERLPRVDVTTHAF